MIIGDKEICSTMPPYIIAEIGLNHNGDLGLAQKTIDAAVNAGADFVKFQHCPPEDFDSSGTHKGENLFDLYKRHQFTIKQWEVISEHCQSVSIPLFITTVSAQGVRDLYNSHIELCAFKVSSDMIRNKEMIGQMRKLKKPIIMSTGHLVSPYSSLGDLYDIAEPDDLILHCESQYPCQHPKLWKMRIIQNMGYACGFSDHTRGIETAIRAVELGALVVEKHFTTNHGLPGIDHHWSLDPTELKQLVQAIK